MLVIDDKGENLGLMATPDAVALAKERGLDLVEVASQSEPRKK